MKVWLSLCFSVLEITTPGPLNATFKSRFLAHFTGTHCPTTELSNEPLITSLTMTTRLRIVGIFPLSAGLATAAPGCQVGVSSLMRGLTSRFASSTTTATVTASRPCPGGLQWQVRWRWHPSCCLMRRASSSSQHKSASAKAGSSEALAAEAPRRVGQPTRLGTKVSSCYCYQNGPRDC